MELEKEGERPRRYRSTAELTRLTLIRGKHEKHLGDLRTFASQSSRSSGSVEVPFLDCVFGLN